jgi:hypothetical protein
MTIDDNIIQVSPQAFTDFGSSPPLWASNSLLKGSPTVPLLTVPRSLGPKSGGGATLDSGVTQKTVVTSRVMRLELGQINNPNQEPKVALSFRVGMEILRREGLQRSRNAIEGICRLAKQ